MAAPTNSAAFSLLLVCLVAYPVAVQGLHQLASGGETLSAPVVAGEAVTGQNASNAADWEFVDENTIRAKIVEILGNQTGKSQDDDHVSFFWEEKRVQWEPPPKEHDASELLMQWSVSRTEHDGHVSFFWDHGCNVGAPAGVCALKKADRYNPAGLHVKLTRPVDEHARARVSVGANIQVNTKVVFPFWLFATCAACDDTCSIKIPGWPLDVVMPPCKHPHGFDVFMPSLDWAKVPPFIKHAMASMVVTRSTTEEIFKATLDVWL
mmetsp:Transcript_39455/g.91549  ORF Transcript_39455/g.91549 Transcript_39455/m.91549 type:complete len:265 (+) Transcript_39455:73-867(+)